MANREYIERLQLAIHQLHDCDSKHLESLPVHEVFRGQTARRGVVEVLTLTGHPKAKRCYAWSHREGKYDTGERFVAVSEIPPVTSPERAVKVAIAGEVRGHGLAS